MDFVKDILPLLFALVLIVLVMYLSFLFSRFIGKRVTGHSKFNNIRIIEQIAFGQDKSLIIAEICGKFYLIGASNQSIEILQELDDVKLTKEDAQMKPDFMNILNQAIGNKWKKHEKGDKDEEI